MSVAPPGRPIGLTRPRRRAFIDARMTRALRTFAAVLAGLALVAGLPAPCGCARERAASRHADEHACCAPPAGVSAADRGCCDEAPGFADAVQAPASPAAPVAVAFLRVEASSALHRLAHRCVASAPSPPPTVLRV
jgi:hypothetical protein